MQLFSLQTPNKDSAIVNYHVPNVACRVSWADCEAVQGTYTWDGIDAALTAAGKQHGSIDLHVLFGTMCPAWLAKEVPYVAGVPVPWNLSYQLALTAFLNALSAQWNGNPNIVHFHICPIGGTSGEFKLDVGTLAEWQAAGYTPTVLKTCFKSWDGAIASLFTSAPRVISWMPGGPTKVFDPTNSKPINDILLPWFSSQANVMNMNSGAQVEGVYILPKTPACGYQAYSEFGAQIGAALTVAQASGAAFYELYPEDAKYVV